MPICPRCGQENPEIARFCLACAAPLAAAALREERKVVTVLFADLVGFTSRSEQLDPEDVRGVLSPYYARLRGELERFGGTVEKFIGDAVMAVFGAPVAHEDDPERGVRAALAIRDWVQDEGDLQVRIAVNTGEALVQVGARPSEGEAIAAGDVVNTAARLQAAAPVNGILVGEQTFRATERAIEYRESHAVRAKGKEEPVAVWEAVQARARVGIDLARETRTDLVGRVDELELLRGSLARAGRERTPQLVTLVGVPGIGKSRLVLELFKTIEGASELIFWRHGRSLPYGEGISFWALAEMVKAQCGVLDTDSEEQAAEKLAGAVAALVPDAAEAQWIDRHLRPLVGLGAEAELGGDRRPEAFAAWRRFFESLGDQRPLVLVFEDLHWADDGLLDFVDHLVDWASGVPILVVCTARPELLSRRPGWGGGKPNAVTISLSPLSDGETARLLAALLERSLLPAETQSALLARAGGNPLYAEQYARMLEERGSVEELPETLQGIIAARLDALAADEKKLLQDAAVVGKVFWLGALSHIGDHDRFALEERLHALERREFVRRERRPSLAGETEYLFSHLLVRDVAYGQIPRSRRAELHRRAAEWIDSLGERAEDRAEMLAHHYLSALDYARAAGLADPRLEEPARLALRAAGDRALGLDAHTAAAGYYERAVELWPQRDPERPHLVFSLGRALHSSGHDRQVEVLEEARDALLDAAAPGTAAEAEALIGRAWWLRGQQDRAFEHLERGRNLVAEEPASLSKARVLAQLARQQAIAARYEDAIEVGGEVLEMAKALDAPELRSHALNTLGIAKVPLGDLSGLEDLERSIEIAGALNSPMVVIGYNNLASVLATRGELRRAYQLWAEALRLAEHFGNRQDVRFARAITSYILWSDGDWDEAERVADAFVAECEAGSPHYQEAGVRSVRAVIRSLRGDEQGAFADHEKALALARDAKDPQMLQPTMAQGVRALLNIGRRHEARALADELLGLLRQARSQKDELCELCWVAGELGRADDVRELLQEDDGTPWHQVCLAIVDEDFIRAAGIFAEMGAFAREAEARLRAARKLIESGRRAEGEVELQRALSFYRSAGATAYVREGEALLAASA